MTTSGNLLLNYFSRLYIPRITWTDIIEIIIIAVVLYNILLWIMNTKAWALIKGIIVVGGAEEEHYNLLGKDRLHPIINVYPEENDIYNKLDSLLANPNFSIIRRQH